jgi:hypothetical protein
MRKIEDVINAMLLVEDIPVSLKEDLLRIMEKTLYCSPESVGLLWDLCYETLGYYLPSTPNNLNEWQKKLLTVWTGKEFK